MEKLTNEQKKILEDNLPFVTYVAKKYFSKTNSIKNQDIIQEGIYAMAKAIPNWDPKISKITTYMYPTIDGHLKRFSYYQDRIIPIPHQKHLKTETINKAEQAKFILSLDLNYSNNDGDESYSLMNILPDKTNVEDLVINKIVITNAIKKALDWKERLVIIYRYYFDLNQTMIGRLMGVSQVHTHRLEKRALSKLKAYLITN